ncbi:hypothetical protein PSECIP111854_00442 [Pseudoalteromonas sp. CIP111854]|uniref:Uncharacterized protein n=1 Tax=Pseudoalteromonas holothuriae TaxID=2963714 RepID=A0A9W4QRG9_9GAMM|nr:hypothetical protein [Pseudoalteromonas sp. CIP111854]CAH9049989.1 hypothetical protein PSECIP111854_00442 [Pseudoalteromonas sp. CIP111854]
MTQIELNDLLYQLGWVLKGYEFLIVLWFLVTQFPTHKWSLFYAHGKALKSLQLHEMHSCFMTSLCLLFFHLLGSEIDMFFLGPLLSGLDDKIKVFYLAGMINQFMFLLAVFYLHRIRRCLFSKTARICLYTTIIVMMLQMMELIARGYFDYHELKFVYILTFWACNLISLAALSIYPIRQTLSYFKKSKQI